MNWIETKNELPPFGTEVLAYDKTYVDEDFNPEGIRTAYLQEDMPNDYSAKWVIAMWNPMQDVWETVEEGDVIEGETIYAPSHWMQKPTPPKS